MTENNQAESNRSENWDVNSEFKPLHEINPLRVNYINQHSPVAGLKVADIGCGGGLVSEGMARLGAKVTGIDMGEAAISVAKLHLLESQLDVEYIQTTAEELPIRCCNLPRNA